jgi:hypothetical protein|tara:strand:+ start:1283 stop:1522 length:240 start_codon:yes stop_codon:yes gene_type:complete
LSSRSSPLRGVDATLEARGERPKALRVHRTARESSRARSSVDAVAEHLRTDPIGIGIIKHIRHVRRDLEDGGADGSRER